MTFWEHLDDLRGVLVRVAATVAVCAVSAFVAMPWIFDNVVLAPCSPDFWLYRLLDTAGATDAVGGFVDFAFCFFHSLFEAVHAFTEAAHQFGDFLASEKQKDGQKDYNPLPSAQVS